MSSPGDTRWSRPVVVAAGALLLASLLPAAGVATATTDPGTAPTTTLTVTDQTFAVAAGSALRLDYALDADAATIGALAAAAATTTTIATITTTNTTTNTTTTAPPTAPPGTTGAAELVVTLHAPVDDPADVEREPSDAVDAVAVGLSQVVTPVASTNATDADDRLVGSVEIAVAIGGDDVATLDAHAPGIHPLTVEVREDDETVALASTYVLVVDPAAPPPATLPIAVLATVDDPGPWAGPEEIDEATAARDQLVTLAEATNATLTVAVPPSVARRTATTVDDTDPSASVPAGSASAPATEVAPTASSVASDGTAAGPGETATPAAPRLADRLIGDELLARPMIPLDPSALAGIHRSTLFSSQLRAGEEALAVASPQALPTRTAWLATEPLSHDGADLLRNFGVQMVIVPADVATAMGVDDDVFTIPLGDGATLPGIVISPLGEQLAGAADTTSASTAAVRLLVTALLEGEDGAAGLVLGSAGVPDPTVTAAFTRHVAATPGVAIVGASQLVGPVLAAGRANAVAVPDEPANDLTARQAAIDEVRPQAAAASSMLVDPSSAPDWDAEFDRLLTSTLDDAQAADRLAAIEEEIDDVLGAVVPPERFTFRITGTTSNLRLPIVNDSDRPLQVVVRVASTKLDADDVTHELLPGENLVRVPVTARSNGTFSVEVKILTPNDVELTRPVVLKADVTKLSGVSRVVTIGAVLALASWWYSHFRRRRRTRRAEQAPGIRLEPGPTLSPDAAESRD